MRQDRFIEGLAAKLRLRFLASLQGGEFGACLVEDADGTQCVLKAWPWPAYADEWRRGVRLAKRMREGGYPAPKYRDVGEAEGACWSLQEVLPGEVPAHATESLLRQLASLAERHADMASDEPNSLTAHIVPLMQRACALLSGFEATTSLADELLVVVGRAADVRLRTTDIVHYDFHHLNCLVVDGTVTGVFDWEGARAGDWRCDLANLAVTSGSRWVAGMLRAGAPPDVAAVLVAWHVLRYLEFDAKVRPHALANSAEMASTRNRAWWLPLAGVAD